MKVLVINPNTTEAMTAMVTQRLRERMAAGTGFIQMTARTGSAVIATQDAFDQAAAVARDMLQQAMARGPTFDRVLLACFGDPGLEAMQALSPVAATGLAQASMHEAERRGQPWAVVTAGPAWKDILAQRFAAWGAGGLFRGVEVLEGSGASILQDPAGMLPAVARAVEQARRSGASNVILGGAVFAGYVELMRTHGGPVQGVTDCVDAAAAHLSRVAASVP